jgi:hypothetical protein
VSNHRTVDDLQIQEALRDRAIRPGDGALAAEILDDVLFELPGAPRARTSLWAPPGPGRLLPILIAGLLLAALVGTLLALSGVMRQANLPHNGAIVSLDDIGEPLQTTVLSSYAGSIRLALPVQADDLGFSPNGNQLVYAHRGVVWVVDLRTSIQDQVLSCGTDLACTVAWSPDGSAIAVMDGGTLRVITPDGRPVATVASRSSIRAWAAWSPSSGQIAYTRAAAHSLDIVIVERDGSNPRVVYSEPLQDPGSSKGGELAWSPDGRRLAFFGSTQQAGESETLDVSTMLVDGTDRHVLIADAASCPCPAWGPGLAWSPDGSQLAASLFVGGPQTGYGSVLLLMNADGLGHQRLGGPIPIDAATTGLEPVSAGARRIIWLPEGMVALPTAPPPSDRPAP